MTNTDETPPGSSTRSIKNTRNLSNLGGLWSICSRTACRRARRCRGTSDTCLRTYLNAVPEGAWPWVLCLFYLTKELGLPFEEALAKAQELEEADIYADWMESIGAWKLGRDFHRVP